MKIILLLVFILTSIIWGQYNPIDANVMGVWQGNTGVTVTGDSVTVWAAATSPFNGNIAEVRFSKFYRTARVVR